MKKFLSIVLACALLLPIIPVRAEYEIPVIVDGVRLEFDQPPIEMNDRVLVPLRKIFEVLGATVIYKEETNTVGVATGDTSFSFTIGSKEVLFADRIETLDVPSMEINGRTLVPVRFVSENCGADVFWENGTVIVKTKGKKFLYLWETYDKNGAYGAFQCNYYGDTYNGVPQGNGSLSLNYKSEKYGFITDYIDGNWKDGVLQSASHNIGILTFSFMQKSEIPSLFKFPYVSLYEQFVDACKIFENTGIFKYLDIKEDLDTLKGKQTTPNAPSQPTNPTTPDYTSNNNVAKYQEEYNSLTAEYNKEVAKYEKAIYDLENAVYDYGSDYLNTSYFNANQVQIASLKNSLNSLTYRYNLEVESLKMKYGVI